jgi:DNA-binding Lrp family transcriptional regulator
METSSAYDGLPSSMTAHRMLNRSTELSDLDRRIIHALQLDGRVSFATLGPQLQSTEKIVRLRTQYLRQSGIIDITVITSPELLGHRHFAYVTLGIVGQSRADVAEKIARIPEVDYMAATLGRYGLWVEVLSPSLQALGETIDNEIAVLDGVSTIAVLPTLSLFHHKAVYLESDESLSVKQFGTTPSTKDLHLDDIDTGILGHLSHDGRMSFQDIGRHLDISGDVVRRRVHRLREAGVIRIMAITHPMTLGFEVVAMVGMTLNPKYPSREVAERLSKIPAVTYTVICGGEFSMLCEVTCQNAAEFQDVMDQLRAVDGIATAEPFVYTDLHYRRMAPREPVGPS